MECLSRPWQAIRRFAIPDEIHTPAHAIETEHMDDFCGWPAFAQAVGMKQTDMISRIVCVAILDVLETASNATEAILLD